MAYSDEIWDQIKKEWVAGQVSITELSRHYGPSRGAIIRQGKTWPIRGTLREEVRREIETALVDEESEKLTPELTPDDKSDTISGAATRGLAIIRTHKGLLSRLLRQVDVSLSDLETAEKVGLDLIRAQRLKNRSKMVTTLMQGRANTMDTISKVLARAIPLERGAFSLDSEKGEIMSIRYVTPEMKKPKHAGLSEDEWGERADE